MIRSFLVLISFLLIGFSVNSQILISIIFGDKLNAPGVEFGIDGGLNLSNISGMQSNSSALDFHLGFYFDVKIKNQWSINTGLLVKSSQGSSQLSKEDVYDMYPDLSVYLDSGDYSQSFGYFNVPIMMKYKFKNHFFIEGGTQLGLMYNARLHYEHEYEDVEVSTSTNNLDSFFKFDMGLLGGIGYKLQKGEGMNIGVKYYYGLLDISKNEDVTMRNNVIYFKVDIPIGKGEK